MMPTRRTPLVLSSIVVAALALATLVGCSGPSVDDSAVPADQSASQPASPTQTLSLEQIAAFSMKYDSKSKLHPEFPAQLPVIDGTAQDVQHLPVEGGGEWRYVLLVDRSSEVVGEWYSRAYPIANWQLLSVSAPVGDDKSGVVLEFAKGNATCRVTITSERDAARVEARVTIGTDGALEL